MVDPSWRDGWPELADIGLPGLCVPEDRGGVGLRVDAAAACATECGAALHGGPLAGLTASAHVLARSNGDPVVDELLEGILVGERICAFGRLAPADQSSPTGQHSTDNGARGAVGGEDVRLARRVDGAPQADALLLLDPTRQCAVLLTEPDTWQLTTGPDGFDVSRGCADVAVRADTLATGRRLTDLGQAVDLYELLLAADALGSVRRMLERTVAYAATRHTFGRPIGATQAVQHRLADHAVRARGMNLVVTEAVRRLGTDASHDTDATGGTPGTSGTSGAGERSRWVALAGASVSSGAPHLLHDLVQLTGGIGFTWEYGLHLHERRVHQDARLAANPRAALRSLVHSAGWADAR
ncbi:acyl-CoA dehydrogenase family protein [Frankia sp. AgPm24]|uniref:acyl-CoA dehydrogenase family protein n=1 Tax=Frankia sp. AgPm24 TaxID=631128 RepID=UPI00200BB81D|nr:acyl-CoA dehydrogenase family protein [Frankia sp. AgPm24]MCK9923760.1 acyl-CoA dehydrogenase family protein [Frankia sp. AgPm24]